MNFLNEYNNFFKLEDENVQLLIDILEDAELNFKYDLHRVENGIIYSNNNNGYGTYRVNGLRGSKYKLIRIYIYFNKIEKNHLVDFLSQVMDQHNCNYLTSKRTQIKIKENPVLNRIFILSDFCLIDLDMYLDLGYMILDFTPKSNLWIFP